MAYGVESVRVQCPCCGENIELLIDCSVETQSYIEDCEVCCRPIAVAVRTNPAGSPEVDVSR